MLFPNYFNENTKFRTLSGKDGKFVEYFHNEGSIKNIFLHIDQVFFVHVIEGVVKLQSPNGVFYIDKGECAIVNKGPYIMSESLSGQGKCFKAFLLFLPKDNLTSFYKEYTVVDREIDASNSNIIQMGVCPFLNVFIDSVSVLFNEPIEEFQHVLIDLKTKELLYYLSLNNLSNKIHNLLHPIIDDDDFKFKQVVQSNYLNTMKLEGLAFLTNMSLSSFKRKFQVIYSMSPAKWIKEKRLEYGLTLLESKKFKVNEIAYKCGFENPITFSHLFRKKYGVLPSHYIQNK